MHHDYKLSNQRHSRKLRRIQEERELQIELWQDWQGELHPDCFDHLDLANDGGLSEAHELYNHFKVLNAVALVAFMVYNVSRVIMMDLFFILHVRNEDVAAAKFLQADAQTIDKFYFCREAIRYVARYTSLKEDDVPSAIMILGCVELAGLLYHLVNSLYCGLSICILKGSGESALRKWFAVQFICWDIIPQLTCYSGMRLFYYVLPAVAVRTGLERVDIVRKASANGSSIFWPILKIMIWLLSLCLCFVVGFDTFLLRLRVVASAASRDDISMSTTTSCAIFLAQVVGVIQLGPFMRERLFVFVFGGEDAIMQESEIDRMEVWHALLARRMYSDQNFFKFIVTILTFSDTDFQKLVFNDRARDHLRKL